jgi:alpha-D-ribose 1-methylphosphonate 5-triphosphate synthase subunit PhnI
LGKARVVERGDFGFKLALGGSTTMTITLNHPHLYDIQNGDLLTLYTEVLLAKPTNTN